MGTSAQSSTATLAALTSELAAACTHADGTLGAIADAAARAATTLIGDCGGIRLPADGGGREPLAVYHHRDPDAERLLADAATTGETTANANAAADETGGGDTVPGTGSGERPAGRWAGGPPTDGSATGRPVVLDPPDRGDLRGLAPPAVVPVLDRIGVSSALVCPLATGDHVLGWLELFRTGTDAATGPGYDESDVDIAREVAERVVVALAAAEAVRRLRASEERFYGIVEFMPDGVWQLDADGITTYVNARMAELLGMPATDLVGLPARGFLDEAARTRLFGPTSPTGQTGQAGQAGQTGPTGPAGPTEHTGLSDQSARTGPAADAPGVVHECRLIRADGMRRWVQVAVIPMHGRQYPPSGPVYLVTDISDRVAARDMRRQLDQFRRSDSLGQLAGGIAHEFNNLLTVIAGTAEVLAGEAEQDPTRHQLARQIAEASARGGALVHQLLAFGRRSPTGYRVCVPELLHDARDLLGRALGEHIRLDVSAGDDLWPVRADRGQLEQLLANLAANARDAMGRGGVLTIEAANRVLEPGDVDARAGGRFVLITVSDTGDGMSGDVRERAFEPFFTTKQVRGAAGLGLTTVLGIARNAGGHVRLYSEPGIGTTVEIYLPACDPPPSTGTLAGDARAGDEAGRRGRILIVEDQPDLAELARRLLQPAGYDLTVATDPAAALAAVQRGLDPDLLLTDVLMPGMTGPELVRVLRVNHPRLRALYMSGYTAGVLNPRAALSDDDVLIQKPFNRDTLLTAVTRVLALPG